MEPNHIPFENLPITNRFMFALVFGHKRIAKPFLKAILGIKIFDLQEPEAEKSAESSLFNKGESYRNLKEQYIIFICPDDIFKQDYAVYKFKNMEIGQPEHELGDLCFKNYNVAEKSVKEYLEYFATSKDTSKKSIYRYLLTNEKSIYIFETPIERFINLERVLSGVGSIWQDFFYQ